MDEYKQALRGLLVRAGFADVPHSDDMPGPGELAAVLEVEDVDETPLESSYVLINPFEGASKIGARVSWVLVFRRGYKHEHSLGVVTLDGRGQWVGSLLGEG
jgi:hypothetical protein